MVSIFDEVVGNSRTFGIGGTWLQRTPDHSPVQISAIDAGLYLCPPDLV
jgi:hypothetical protein